MTDLTPKEHKFVLAYIETGSPVAAYRAAGYSTRISDNAQRVEATRILQRPNVSLMVTQLQQEHAARHNITVEVLTEKLMAAEKLAHATESASAAVAAIMGMGKLHGLITDKVKSETTVTRETDQMTDDELAAIAAGRSPASASKAASSEESDSVH